MTSHDLQQPKLADAAARLRDAGKIRYSMMRDQAGAVWYRARTQAPSYWQEYKPRTLLQWTGFCGLLLLAISALSTIINILGGVTLALAWIGLVVYFFTVSASTVAGFFCGSAMMMFSATTAIMGTSILAGVTSVYAMLAVYKRANGYAAPFVEAIQQRRSQQQLPPTAQMRYASQGSPVRLAPAGADMAVSTDTTSSTSALLHDMSPGKPQFSEHVSPTSAPADSHSYSSDATPKSLSANTTKAMRGGSTAQHSVGGSGVSQRAAAVSST